MDMCERDVSGYDHLTKPEPVSESRLAERGGFPGEQTSDGRKGITPQDRVRKHRAKLQGQQRRRLEVWISTPLIETMSRIATGHQVPLWAAVQKALEVYVQEYRELAAESRRLIEECTRLQKQADSPERRRQIEEYNRKLADWRERFARFQQPNTVSC
jgi:hypothetical protein